MSLKELLDRIERNEPFTFEEVLAVIERYYRYTPTGFANGPDLYNAPGENEGSCKVFAFARRHGLSDDQTLALFGQHGRAVLADPAGTGHANIRAFLEHGRSGIHMESEPLLPL